MKLRFLLLFIFGTARLFCGDTTVKMVFNESVPWKIIQKDHTYEGIDLQVVKLMTRRLHLHLAIIEAPLARSLEMMKTGEADIMTFILRTPDRESYIYYLEPPYLNRNDKAFYLVANSPIQLNSYEDLYNHKIGVKRGSKYFPRFDSDENLDKEYVPDTLLNFRKLILHRIDIAAVTETEGDYLLAKSDFADKIKKAPFQYDAPTSVYIGISRKSPLINLVPQLQDILRELIRSGEIEKIRKSFTQ